MGIGRVGMVALVVFSAGAALAACGGTASTPTAGVIVDATTGADSAHVTSTFQLNDSGVGAIIAFEASGAIDFTHQRGDLTEKLLPVKSTTTVPGQESSSSSGGTTAPSEVRWIGADVYSRGAAPGALPVAAANLWTLYDGTRVHAAVPCIPANGLDSYLGTGGDPASVLATLRSQGITLTRVGTETVRGVATTHWRAAARVSTSKPCPPSGRVGSTVKQSLDVWTDGQNRARRIHISLTISTPARSESFPDAKPATTVRLPAQTQTADTTTEYFDFGTPVRVQAPPADQVEDTTAGFIAVMQGTGTITAAGWRVAAHGTLSSGPWTVYSAQTTTGWDCYSSTGTLEGEVQGLGSPSSSFPKHGADGSTCAPPDNAEELGVFDAIINATDSGKRIFVGFTTALGAAHVVLTNGSSRPLAIDPETHVAVWSQPASTPAPVSVVVGTEACRIDGSGDPLAGIDPSGTPETNPSAAQTQCSGATPSEPLSLPGFSQSTP